MTRSPRPTVVRAPGLLVLPEPPEGIRRVPVADRSESVVLHHDTEDLALVRWGASLCHRDGTWVLRLPPMAAIPDSPTEHRWTAGPSTPPAEARALVTAMVRHRPLVRVARVVTRRATHRLLDAEDGLIAELHDDEVSVYHGRRMVERFREFVLVPGEGAASRSLDVVRDLLLVEGCLDLGRDERLLHVLGPSALAPADVERPALPDEPVASDVLHAAIGEGTRRLVLADPHARAGVDEEGVHQARVATRRLRSDLRTFCALLDPSWLADTRAELAWLADALGQVRDADVLALRLGQTLRALPESDLAAGAILEQRLERQRDGARGALVAALHSDRYLTLLDRLVAAAAAPPLGASDRDGPARDVLVALVARPWTHLRDVVRTLTDAPSDEDLHRVRILAKRLRYAAEATAPVMGRPATRLASAAARLQTVLGEHHDACVAEAWLRGAVAELDDPAAAFVAGMLAGGERARADRTAAAWRDAWSRLDTEKVRGWL